MPLLVVVGYGPGVSHATAVRFGAEGRLRPEGVYVGQITINGSVAGTATASPTAIAPSDVADRLWSMTRTRDTTRVTMSEGGTPIDA